MKIERNTPEMFIFQHQHQVQRVAPSGAAHVGMLSGAGAYNLGNFSNDILGDGIVPENFDLHWLIVLEMDVNAWYEVVFYYGGADTECARATFGRSNPQTQSITVPIMTEILPSGSRVRAKMMDSVGASTCQIKVMYHYY